MTTQVAPSSLPITQDGHGPRSPKMSGVLRDPPQSSQMRIA